MTELERRVLHHAPPSVVEEFELGWRIEPTNGGHLRWSHPSGALVHAASTPSDRRAWSNHLANLRRERRDKERRREEEAIAGRPGISLAFAARLLATIHGDPSTIEVAERVWIRKWCEERGTKHAGTNRRHGYRQLAGAWLKKFQAAGLVSSHGGSRFGTGMQWRLTEAGRKLLEQGE